MTGFSRLPLLAALALPFAASAGVQSLSTQEMVETYIKDSAIIVVPRQVEPARPARPTRKNARETVIQSITISPAEAVVSEAEIERARSRIRDTRELSFKDAEALAEEQLIRQTLIRPLEEIAALQPTVIIQPDLPNLIYGQQPIIPTEPFREAYLNNQLGLDFDGQNVTFSIGNLPGVSQINVPQAITEGPIQLNPRPGGGFDLTIAVPEAR